MTTKNTIARISCRAQAIALGLREGADAARARQWAAAYERGASDGRVAYEQADDGETAEVWVTTRHGNDPTYVNAARSFWDGVHGNAAAEEGLDDADDMLRMAHAEGFLAGWNNS